MNLLFFDDEDFSLGHFAKAWQAADNNNHAFFATTFRSAVELINTGLLPDGMRIDVVAVDLYIPGRILPTVTFKNKEYELRNYMMKIKTDGGFRHNTGQALGQCNSSLPHRYRRQRRHLLPYSRSGNHCSNVFP